MMPIKSCFRTREVSARRARKLRKRGEDVWFSHLSNRGKKRYEWFVGLMLMRADQP
jgi:hypothetical protein